MRYLAGAQPIPLDQPPTEIGERLGDILLEEATLDQRSLDAALSQQKWQHAAVGEILCAWDEIDEDTLFTALARQFGTTRIRPADTRVDTGAIDRLGAHICARSRILPLPSAHDVTPVATSRPHGFARIRPMLEDRLGPVTMRIVSDSDLDQMLTLLRKDTLVARAETRTAADVSCRQFAAPNRIWHHGLLLLAGLAILALLPGAAFNALTILALGALCLNTAFVLMVATAALRHPHRSDTAETPPVEPARLPKVSILVPLREERDIAGTLIARLSRIAYPRALLEICLVTEARDNVTRAAIAKADLPCWMRVITVPEGSVMTKPRAMNYALDFCSGDVIGIYDAEDAPPPDQIMTMVRQLNASDPRVACLQGRLNFYNPRASWITRCFAIDYATWFHLILPGLRAVGWPIPLGGTTVFLRRAVLESLGAWDAHNVTEDADLGIRLARHGWRVDILDSETEEEATIHPRAWIRQRSRWLKGYALTWAVHMRRPIALWRDLGAWRFAGFQLLFLGALSGFATAPILWSFWLLPLGLPHPWIDDMPGWMIVAIGIALIASGLTSVVASAIALCRSGRQFLLAWLPALQIYFAMGSFAVAKALFEVAVRPFYWDKTVHGVSPPDHSERK